MAHIIGISKIQMAIYQLKSFLEPYVALANTHGADFLSNDHWDKFISKTCQTHLLQLSRDDLVDLAHLPSSNFGETSQEDCGVETSSHKIKDLGSFISQARQCHLDNLGVLTSVRAALGEQHSQASTEPAQVISEAMSEKKIHEVGIMVDAVSTLYASIDSSLVVDIGSGKGYFASELSHKMKIPVIGLDSSDTNTHGASRRDKKLAKKWTGLERRVKSGQHKVKPPDCNLVGHKTEGEAEINEPDAISESDVITMDSASAGKSLTSTNTRVAMKSEGSLMPADCGPPDKAAEDGAAYTYVDNNSETVERDKVINRNTGKGDKLCKDRDKKLSSDHNLYVPVTLYVDPAMDLSQTVRENAPCLLAHGDNLSQRLLLTGLHTCGSLAVTTIRLFLSDPHAVGLCCVGCCYQLMEECCGNEPDSQLEVHFPLSSYGKDLGLNLGRNARNLASQSVHRIRASGQLQGSDFYWRALLDVLLRELSLPVPERILGMRGLNRRCKTFHQYVAAVLSKLGLEKHTPEPCVVEDLIACHGDAQLKMAAFFQVKLVLAPVIEGLILLDRLAFLLEQEAVKSAHLVPLFDPVTSPRCYALIAQKKEQL